MSRKKLARVIATWLVTGIMVSVFVLDIATIIFQNHYVAQTPINEFNLKKSKTADRIHFLNTANSDCILIETNGKFALVDSGEGNENPRRDTEYKGYRDEVISYLKKVAADKNGIVHLEFIVATHLHYDHAGNFEEIIKDKNFDIKKAYIKEYTARGFTDTENENWGNYDNYLRITDALKEKRIRIINDIPETPFEFGDFTATFYNTRKPDNTKGDNANSIGIKLQKNGKTAFLAADFTKDTGLEELYGKEIGDVDLLKIGHHGYFGSSSADFLRILKPEIAICTNYIGKIYPNVKWNLTVIAKAPIFSTEHRNGIVAEFTRNDIKLYENIM